MKIIKCALVPIRDLNALKEHYINNCNMTELYIPTPLTQKVWYITHRKYNKRSVVKLGDY
jgi:hypothetical protein